MSKHRTTDLDLARDELFSHIHRCGVLKAARDQQEAWLEDTVGFLGERYPALGTDELDQLREIGSRFCLPAIPHGKEHTALNSDDEEGAEESQEQEQEMAGAA